MADGGIQSANRQAVDAPAKLNLYLHIVGRRADGYHLLESLIAFTSVGDRLTARPSSALSLDLDGPFADTLRGTSDDDNLVLKAARALAAWAARNGSPLRGAALSLTKNLPVASGIGGGSSDAAAALSLLKRLWTLPIEAQALEEIAAGLGSDIPACIAAKACMMEGIGEKLSSVPALPEAPVLLVNPGVGLSTPSVYKTFKEKFAIPPVPRPKPVGPFADVQALVTGLAATDNDLEAPAISLCPAVQTVLDALKREGALLARMSGSGATCFGIFANAAAIERAAQRITSDSPQWWVSASRLRGGA